jgi:hypothetical protein
MALWGNKDSKTASGTIAISTAGAVTGTSTSFTTEAKVGNYITAGGRDYQIVNIASNTAATVISGTNNGNGSMTAVSGGSSYALSEKPAFVAHESADSSGRSGNSSKVYGVNLTEAGVTANKAKGLTTPGWVRYTTYTDAQGNTRHKSEVLVAGGAETGGTGDWSAATSGDAADDSVLADA